MVIALNYISKVWWSYSNWTDREINGPAVGYLGVWLQSLVTEPWVHGFACEELTNVCAVNACRYSASTIDALEMMDDDKVDLDLIAALIRHIVLEEEVRTRLSPVTTC